MPNVGDVRFENDSGHLYIFTGLKWLRAYGDSGLGYSTVPPWIMEVNCVPVDSNGT